MSLEKQVQIFSIDTGNLYSNRESYLHGLNHRVRQERNKMKPLINKLEEELLQCGLSSEDIKAFQKKDFSLEEFTSCHSDDVNSKVVHLLKMYEIYKHKTDKASETKNKMIKIMQNKVEANKKSNGRDHIRQLRFLDKNGFEREPIDSDIISVFDSAFTRTIGAEPDKLSEDFMVVHVYYFEVIKDAIYYGFEYNGEKYIYFTSSAGQIRTKKCVFVKESVYKKYEKTIMCGLTIDIINSKGGNNPNKHLAYMALVNSATDEWTDFDIDKSIVIDDFETNVSGIFDFVNDEDYSITRMNNTVPITHTDGAGMILNGKNRMARLPWIKGLLGKFPFRDFIELYNCSPIIKDIYGKEHDIIAEDIQVIFTKSQFKMWKYYDSWEQYKEYFKMYGCTAGYTNMEEDRIKDATINYQMLQSLTDITDEEIKEIAKESINRLNNLCTSIDNIKQAFGATPYNLRKSPLQEAICLYPELLNDGYIRAKLKDMKDSTVKRYKAGKLQVRGKYTFLLPDFFAACQHWFLGEEQPTGLLNDGEVFCWLFKKSDELDCLRSPHLYKEHAVRKNIACNIYGERQKELRKWFVTDAIYTSSFDLISKILQFDVDGDKSLVVSDKSIISVAKRNMEGIVPLYYNMRKASPSILSSDTIYDGLSSAFTGSNIGLYSNDITKIYNSEVFISGSDEEKQEALNVIKLLCMENNFKIDYAKTLYMPTRPAENKELITSFTKHNVPYFFVYAKDKEERQVEPINLSFINKLNAIIPNPRITCKYIDNDGKGKKLNKPDYTLLMSEPNYELLEDDNEIIEKYLEISKQYFLKIDAMMKPYSSDDSMSKSKLRQSLLYESVAREVREYMSVFGHTDEEIADILVRYLYGEKESKYKDILWNCYGECLLNNLKKNISCMTKDIQCECGEWFTVSKFNSATCRCPECQKEITRIKATERKRKQRKKHEQ